MIRLRSVVCSLALLVLLTAAASAAQRTTARTSNGAALPPGMVAVNTPAYTLYSDLPRPMLDEIIRRLEKMVAQYRQRTASLSGERDNRKLPLYLFSDRQDYINQGGRENSTGCFDGERLLAYVGTRPDARAWHAIQHEAFHQYFTGKMGYEVPVWLNEGLAEYFSESLYTGDGFVSGVVPLWRLKRLQDSIKAGKLLPIAELIDMSLVRWNAQFNQENYDMAWSLVQYLAHGDNGAYRDGMDRYIQQARTQRLASRAFREIFGDADALQERWKAYWLNFPEAQSKRTFAVAAMQTLCSYLARARLSHQVIKDMPQLESLLSKGELRQPTADTLPISLLAEYLQWAPQLGTWDLRPKAGAAPELLLDDGVKIKGRYTLRNGRVDQVEAWVDDGKPNTPHSGGRE